MISDGYGPASATFARTLYQRENNLPRNARLPLDELIVGTVQTYSQSNMITDSGAAATAYACGIKTKNYSVGVDELGRPCGTILEAAKAAGYATGIVVTSKVTDATPASFTAHLKSRTSDSRIAEHLVGLSKLGPCVDLMMGGGRCIFLPKSQVGSCRDDEKNLVEHLKGLGYKIIQDRVELIKANSLPFAGLFSNDKLPREVDRGAHENVRLSEMTSKALELLSSSNNDKGFFLMIEGSQIDSCAHKNDPKCHYNEILEYQSTVALVKKFIDANPDTTMISVADHETGGLALSLQEADFIKPEYNWNTQAILNQKRSFHYIAEMVNSYQGNSSSRMEFMKSILAEYLGITDPTSEELKELFASTDVEHVNYILGRIMQSRAKISWSTHGHSSIDVNLYSYGQHSQSFRGNWDNIEISKIIEQLLQINTSKITEILRKEELVFNMNE